jgi:hypothetical protein
MSSWRTCKSGRARLAAPGTERRQRDVDLSRQLGIEHPADLRASLWSAFDGLQHHPEMLLGILRPFSGWLYVRLFMRRCLAACAANNWPAGFKRIALAYKETPPVDSQTTVMRRRWHQRVCAEYCHEKRRRGID